MKCRSLKHKTQHFCCGYCNKLYTHRCREPVSMMQYSGKCLAVHFMRHRINSHQHLKVRMWTSGDMVSNSKFFFMWSCIAAQCTPSCYDLHLHHFLGGMINRSKNSCTHGQVFSFIRSAFNPQHFEGLMHTSPSLSTLLFQVMLC